jgi:deoxyribose-phosphate aldolase
VLAFPHGVIPTALKESEAKLYIALGVQEIDMVANYGYIRSHEWKLVQQDIAAVASITKQAGVLLKVIIETAMLTIGEIAKSTDICAEAGANYIKTSTGFNGEGATEAGVKAMLNTAAGRILVKASGGIRDRDRAQMFINMGCSRLGVGYNSTKAICDETKHASRDDY